MPHPRPPVLAGLVLLAATGLALPAAAQICGGDAQWLGAEADGDVSTSETPLVTAADVAAGQRAIFAFRVSGDALALRVEAEAPEGDPAISLLTEDGDLIAENDDTAVSLNSLLETSVGPGVYCVALRSANDGALAATVQVSRQDQPALLAGDNQQAGMDAIAPCTTDTPAEALSPEALNGRLDQGLVTTAQDGTTHYYRFSLSQPMPLTLRAASPTLDPVLKLFDGQGVLLAENDDADGLNARLDFASPLAAGDYCVAAASLSGQPGEVTLSAEKLDPEAFLRNAYRRGELAPPADGGFPIQEVDLDQQTQTVVLHDGAAQWLGLALDQPTVLIISGYGSFTGADPKLVLFAASGAPVAENDDIDGSTNARLGPVLLEPGRYHLGVIDVSRNDGTTGPIRPIGLIFDRFQRVP